VTSGVDERLGYIGWLFPAISAFLKAVDSGASEEEFDVRHVGLVAPEQIEVAGQAARVVIQCRVDFFGIGAKM
jgi:hypothetical protein